jgi:hypothetical protein
VPQTVSFLREIVADGEFRAVALDTGFVPRFVERQRAAAGAGGDGGIGALADV